MSQQQKQLEESIRAIVRSRLNEKIHKRHAALEKNRQEKQLRFFVRQRLLEAKKNPIPHESTGANMLEETLRKVVPIIKDAFFTLTSDINQRRSYRAHIINAFRMALSPYRVMQGYDKMSPGEDKSELEYGLKMPGENEPDRSMNEEDEEMPQRGGRKAGAPNPDSADQKFIEVEPERQKKDEVNPEEEEMKKFSIEGEDATGRNLALVSFKKIEKTIADDYSMLSLPKDREVFYEYGIINLKIYFDRWEKELQMNLPVN